MQAEEILNFWFKEIDTALWWKKDSSFDALIQERFATVHRQACLGELYSWRKNPAGRLAEIIILDQFSRNMFRDKAAAFAQDPQALTLAQEAIAQQADATLTQQQRIFLYLPFMHSESLLVHETAVQLYTAPGLQGNLDFEYKHKAIIARFGRYPHRNALLGRESTPEELKFLQEPGSSF